MPFEITYSHKTLLNNTRSLRLCESYLTSYEVGKYNNFQSVIQLSNSRDWNKLVMESPAR